MDLKIRAFCNGACELTYVMKSAPTIPVYPGPNTPYWRWDETIRGNTIYTTNKTNLDES